MSTTITNLPETSKVNGSDYLILDQPDKTVKSTVSNFLADTGVVLATQLKDTDGADLIQSSNGNTVQEELNNNLLNDREQWHRSLAEAGLTLVNGSFEEGATVSTSTDAVWHIAGGQCYTWGGEFPKTVAAGSTPDSTGGIGLGAWDSVGDAALRNDINNGYLNTKYFRVYQNVDDMMAGNLRAGDNVTWNGYYNSGDGGGNIGIVVEGQLVSDNGSIFPLVTVYMLKLFLINA